MKITKEQLKRMIKEELDEIRMDTTAGYSSNQGSSVPAPASDPKANDLAELKAIIAAKEKETGRRLYEPEWDEERGSWVLDFETGDNTHWYFKPPPGWEVEERDRGAHDGDEQYILYKPSTAEGRIK